MIKAGSQECCSYFNQNKCRSCEWMDQDYSVQIQQKEAKVREALSFFPSFSLLPTLLSAQQGFRNRAKMVVTGTLVEPIIGILGDPNDLDRGREILACPIHHEKLNQIIAAMPAWIQAYQLIPYKISERKGELKGFITFYCPETRQAYLRFILRSKECVARIKKLLPTLQQQFPELVCVSANIQPIAHAIQEGPEEIFITQNESIDLKLGSIQLKLAPQAFVQTALQVALQLYETAARWIGELRPQRVLELFCGQGAFSLVAAHQAPEFIGIEMNAQAVKSANETVRLLGWDHIHFEAADATQVLEHVLRLKADLILVNPPRRGLSGGVNLIRQALPLYLIYSSCSIESMARDLRALSDLYSIKKAQIFDLFPHTSHFETLVYLERKGQF